MNYYQSDQALKRIEDAQNKCTGKGYAIFEDLIYLLEQIIVSYQHQDINEDHEGKINEEGFFVFTDYLENEQENPDGIEEFGFEEKEVRFAFCSIKNKAKNLISFVGMERADYKELLNDYVSIKEDDDKITVFIDIEGINRLDC